MRWSLFIWRPRTKEVLGERWNVEWGEDLVWVEEVEIPVDVTEGGGLCQEMAYGNHRSTNEPDEKWQRRP